MRNKKKKQFSCKDFEYLFSINLLIRRKEFYINRLQNLVFV